MAASVDAPDKRNGCSQFLAVTSRAVVRGHICPKSPKGDPHIQPVRPRDSVRSRKATAVFDGCRDRVEELLDARADMGVVERTIDAYALDRDEKDALWLWSHGRAPRGHARGLQRSVLPEGHGHD